MYKDLREHYIEKYILEDDNSMLGNLLTIENSREKTIENFRKL